jgi:hypothetical protein
LEGIWEEWVIDKLTNHKDLEKSKRIERVFNQLPKIEAVPFVTQQRDISLLDHIHIPEGLLQEYIRKEFYKKTLKEWAHTFQFEMNANEIATKRGEPAFFPYSANIPLNTK